ncbi:MAG: PspA/IM30 family protein [Planctomycetes bacterium]|nr:PspA/IM30 family protein [Planctomycetota bacterium]
MWARLKRMFRSILGAFIEMGEDPKMILEQNVRDMQDKVPEINSGLAKARAGIIRLEEEASDYEKQIRSMTAKVRACLASGEEKLAADFAVRLKRVQEALSRNQEQLKGARAGYDSLVKLKEKYMSEMKRKTDEAMQAIREADSAKWKTELAGVFESFEVAGVDTTHDEMISKLKAKGAEAAGKLAMAGETVNMKEIDLEERAREMEGKELLQQFKLEMGLATPSAAAAAAPPAKEGEKTIGPAERERAG